MPISLAKLKLQHYTAVSFLAAALCTGKIFKETSSPAAASVVLGSPLYLLVICKVAVDIYCTSDSMEPCLQLAASVW